MRLLAVFLRHELTTQIRSPRFHGVTLAYLAASTAPAIAVYVVATRRATQAMGGGMYGQMLDTLQPLATTLFALAIAVDAISRERDENSLPVVSMASVSAAGYVLRRWLALALLLLPVTLFPRLVAIALTTQSERGAADPLPILLGWGLHVVPLLFVATAFAIALGTITSRTVLALIIGFLLFTVGLGIVNDLLAYTHRQFSPPFDFFGFDPVGIERMVGLVKGYVDVTVPTVAGYPLARQVEQVVTSGALAFAAVVFLLGTSCSYLRRTKRDLRPWSIRETHPLRTYLRVFNRIREEYAWDGGREVPDRVAMVAGLAIAIAILLLIQRRHDGFERLAAERYQSLSTGVRPMPLGVVPVSAALRGSIARNGDMQASATIVVRNDTAAAQRSLAFQLNRGLAIERIESSRGTARVRRVWERVGVEVDPPLAKGESRTITFELSGASASYDFALPLARSWPARWRRYAKAEKSFDMADLSQSLVRRDATAERMMVAGPMLFPVPRYTAWSEASQPWWRREETPDITFVSETVRPLSAISIDLRVPRDFLAVDSCGVAVRARVVARCSLAMADYTLLGTRYELRTLGGGVRLAYMPPHAGLAEKHTPGLANAIQIASESWPTFSLPARSIFIERPAYPNETYFGEWRATAALRAMVTMGAMTMIPEPMFIRFKSLDPPLIAASLIADDLRRRRPVRPEQLAFFRSFYETVALWRTGGRHPSPVEPAGGPRPITDPILTSTNEYQGPIRLSKVLADVEYRVGADRLVAGVEDFVAAGRTPGTARELLDAIARRGGVSLDRVYTDYFTGNALPRLTLADVRFARTGDVWEARGSVKNVASGEVFCPVVLRTAFGSVSTTVRVDSESSTSFVIRSVHEPRTLQLDPDRVVYRHAAIGTIESVDYKRPS